MKKIFTIFVFFLCISPLWGKQKSTSLKERFSQAHAGDFVVTTQQKNYSLLCIREISDQLFVFEEISVPTEHINLKKIDWKQWVAKKAPGHTSWTLSTIDKGTGSLLSCFSYSKNEWLYLDFKQQFLSSLLSLPLSPIPPSERKKIGPKPGAGEQDHRAVWNPPLIIDGKKMDQVAFEALKGRWPDDGSPLALCFLELYFAKSQNAPIFPCWLEVKTPHFTFKLRTIDSGSDLISPMPLKR